MKRAVFACLACLTLLLGACDPYALQRRVAALRPWVGRSEAELVRYFGVPARTIDANGHRFLAYVESDTSIQPPFPTWYPYGFGPDATFPAQVVQYTCETTFEIAGGHVAGFTLRGNACG
jgi:hypothetical protein